MKINTSHYRISTEDKVSLDNFRTDVPFSRPDDLDLQLVEDREKIARFQTKLYAENRQALLIIFQGMDGSGKDSCIKHIMSGVNPQGVVVTSFKHPSALELSHDYLWRHYIKLPEQGNIGIFNRSHYENVLISKVHPELILAERIPGILKVSDLNHAFWKSRYRQIRHFEETLNETGTHVLKFFLHLSKAEQKKRFLERIEEKQKHWKFSTADIEERAHWDEYKRAYEKALQHTGTKDNPWFVIPADDKWFTHLLISSIIIEKLKSMKIAFPVADNILENQMQKAKAMLLKEG